MTQSAARTISNFFGRAPALPPPKGDLASTHATWETPLSTNYHGYDVYEMPPSTQGFAALEMMNILEVCAPKLGQNLAKKGEGSQFSRSESRHQGGGRTPIEIRREARSSRKNIPQKCQRLRRSHRCEEFFAYIVDFTGTLVFQMRLQEIKGGINA